MWLKRLALLAGLGLLMVGGVPLLVIALLIGSRLLMIVAGPVNIFNTTWSEPPAADLAGEYAAVDTDYAARNFPKGAAPRIRLRQDHTMEVFDLPQFRRLGTSRRVQPQWNGHLEHF
jgi:hypothetical protein